MSAAGFPAPAFFPYRMRFPVFSNKKLRNTIFVLLGVVLVVIVTSPRIRLFGTGSSGTSGEERSDGPLPVMGYIIQPQRIDNRVRTTGTVLANEEVELRSEVSGKIEQISFREGSRVAKGEMLLKINDDELQAQIKKFDAQLQLARDVERRRRQLYENKNISPEDYERTVFEVNAIEADIELYRARIEKTEIRAPFDGVIGLRYVSEGSIVSPSVRIAQLQDVRRVKVDFSIPEKYSNAIRIGDAITFRRDGSDHTYRGSVFAIEPKIDPVTRTLLLRAIADNDDRQMMPGAFAEVDLVLSAVEDALVIPTEALVPELQGQMVFLYRGGIATPQPVETGVRLERSIQITKGLSVSDTVITSGILQIRPGMPVELSSIATP